MPTKKATAKKELEYSVWVKMNGKEQTIETNDLEETIASLNVPWIHTEVYFKVSKGEKTAERRLLLNNAKRVLRNPFNRRVFINNLLLT